MLTYYLSDTLIATSLAGAESTEVDCCAATASGRSMRTMTDARRRSYSALEVAVCAR